ncbi:Bax inhibitor-1/YccA family protein [uncultured Holdemanella sp.]|uniref:Bax inhibitor-1/YccA family protein n=1 Tax=uncultured Holdemanella sp. TaxID=1763549 RepID=UPI002805446D|nr:Bax inhibitor-1/YccA family protein [uncultured Holdemanella sp.]
MYSNNYSNSVSTNSLYKVYSWMMVGLCITAITSALLYAAGIFMFIIQIPMISLLLLIVQISLTISMGRQLSRNTPVSTMKTMFIIYSLTMGINMTSLAYCYSAGQIAAAFGISAIYFACLAIIGKTTKMDLSKVGNICLIGLVAMIFSQLFFMLFRVSMDVRLWSVIGLLLFTGLTAWDIQKMNYMLNGYEDEKISIYMALQLYLDFLNIFLYILQLVGRRDD